MSDDKYYEAPIGIVAGALGIGIISVLLNELFQKNTYEAGIVYTATSTSLTFIVSFYALYLLLNRNEHRRNKHEFFASVCLGACLAMTPVMTYYLMDGSPDKTWMYLSSAAFFTAIFTGILSLCFGRPQKNQNSTNST